MRRTFALSIALAIGLNSTAASSEPVPENFPACHIYRLPDGLQVCGFVNIEDWKDVLKADRELTLLRVVAKKMEEKVVNLSSQVATLEGEVDALGRAQGVLATRNEELTRELIETDRKLQSERAKPTWGNALPWAIALASTSILLGFAAEKVLN